MRNMLVVLVAVLGACVEPNDPFERDACRDMCETWNVKLCVCGYGCSDSTFACEEGAAACSRTSESCDSQRQAVQTWTCADVDAFIRWVSNAPRDQIGACGG